MNQEFVDTDCSILYKCNSCEASFNDKSDVVVHLQTHIGSKVYECTNCETLFGNPNDWLNHLYNHGAKYFKCSKCSALFQLVPSFAKHIQSHDYEKLYQCQHCEYNSPGLRTIRIHLRTHKEEGSFKCDICGRTYRQMSSLKKHLRLHSEDNDLNCTRCNKKFESSWTLRKHLNSRKGCNNYVTDNSNNAEVVSITNFSLRSLFENETFCEPVKLLEVASSPSGPHTICSPESISVEGALSGHEGKSRAARCSEIPQFLSYSRPEIECFTENFIIKSNTPRYISGFEAVTHCDSPRSSYDRSSTDTSTHSVSRSQEESQIFYEEVMRSGPASPNGNSKACATKYFSATRALTENKPLFAPGEYSHNGQQDKNIPRPGNDEVRDLNSTAMTTSSLETELESGPIGDSSSFFGTHTIDQIFSLTGSPTYSDLVELYSLGPPCALSSRVELSTTELSSASWTHSTL